MTGGSEDGPPVTIRSSGTLSHLEMRANVGVSGIPVPFSMRDKVDALTWVSLATALKESRSDSLLRLIYCPNSATFITGSSPNSVLTAVTLFFLAPIHFHLSVNLA